MTKVVIDNTYMIINTGNELVSKDVTDGWKWMQTLFTEDGETLMFFEKN